MVALACRRVAAPTTTMPVVRTDINAGLTATGALQPLRYVDAQVSGVIPRLRDDAIPPHMLEAFVARDRGFRRGGRAAPKLATK